MAIRMATVRNSHEGRTTWMAAHLDSLSMRAIFDQSQPDCGMVDDPMDMALNENSSNWRPSSGANTRPPSRASYQPRHMGGEPTTDGDCIEVDPFGGRGFVFNTHPVDPAIAHPDLMQR